MKLELITLLGQKMNQDVYEVILPTASGEISVFPGHEPLVSLAIPGIISVRHNRGDRSDQMDMFATDGGIIEISPQRVRVLVDEAAAGEDIIEEETKAALERAQKLREDAKDLVELENATQMITRHATRLKLAELRRRHRR